MIKAYDTSAGGTPMLIFGITPEDARLLASGQCISTNIRSKSGIEAYLLVTGGPSDEALLEKMKRLGVAVAEILPASALEALGEEPLHVV